MSFLKKPDLTVEQGVRLLQVLHCISASDARLSGDDFVKLKADLADSLDVPICFGLDDCSSQAWGICTHKYNCADVAEGKPIKFVEV